MKVDKVKSVELKKRTTKLDDLLLLRDIRAKRQNYGEKVYSKQGSTHFFISNPFLKV